MLPSMSQPIPLTFTATVSQWQTSPPSQMLLLLQQRHLFLPSVANSIVNSISNQIVNAKPNQEFTASIAIDGTVTVQLMPEKQKQSDKAESLSI